MGNEGCEGRKERDIGEIGPGPGSSQGFCIWRYRGLQSSRGWAGSRCEGGGLGPEQGGCQGTHNEDTGRAEGVGAAGVEVSGIEGDQDTNEVETLGLGETENSGLQTTCPKLLGPQSLPPHFLVRRRAGQC